MEALEFMDALKLIKIILNGEDSYTQFKEQAITAKDLAKEFVAFSNAEGGIVIFGIANNGEIKGLSSDEIEKIGQLVGNTANENVKPPIHPLTKNITIDNKKVMVIFVKNGTSKPYKTSSGVFYTKSGADKKIISDEELRRLFAESKRLYADEAIVTGSDISDLDSEQFYKFLEKDNNKILKGLKNNSLDLITILNNYNLMSENHLTLAGNLLFGINTKKYSPMFFIDCCYFKGNDSSSNSYHYEKRIYGTFQYLFENSLAFITSNLKSQQSEENFNTSGKLEIDESILVELIINALIHRDYYINSSIKFFMFDDRIEIINPGKLTNSLTIEKIKNGIAISRNPILDSIVKNLLPYSGRGSGIKRTLSINPNIEFINDIDKEEFKCIIPREA
jgi:predicted HTH transcriptional regulator